MKDSHQFYAYRYFCVKSAQISFLHDLDNKKPIDILIENCINDKEISVEFSGKSYLLIYSKNFNKSVSLFKFSRVSTITKYEHSEDSKDIVLTREADYPFVYIIIDTNRQIILLENNSSIFRKIDNCKSAFESFVNIYSAKDIYTFSIDEITESTSFWNKIDSAENIYQLTLQLKSPNLFKGHQTSKVLQELKDSYNNDEVELQLKNKNGNLKIEPDELESPLNYISEGGGKWKLTYRKKGKTRKTTSSSEKEVKILEISNFEEELLLEGFDSDIVEKINSLSEFMPNNDEEGKQ